MPDATAVYKSVLDGTMTQIRAASLPGCPDENVVEWPVPDMRLIPKGTFPAVFVGMTGEPEGVGDGTNERDDILHPVGIFVVFKPEAGKMPSDETMNRFWLWRQMIRRHFSRRRTVVSGFDAGIDQVISPGPTLLGDVWISDGYLVSVLTLYVTTREPRENT